LLKLPPYAPEFNPIEHVWDELHEKFLHNRVFKSLDALEDHLAEALKSMEENATADIKLFELPAPVRSLKPQATMRNLVPVDLSNTRPGISWLAIS
jgi:hypothetical protein